VLHKRINTFNQKTKEVIDHYELKTMVHQIDANREEELIYKDAAKLFKEYITKS